MSTRRLEVPPEGFRRISIIRLSSLGDVVLTLPAVHALRHAWPDAHITYWTKSEYRDVVCHDPAVSHVRVLEPGDRKIEDVVSMSAELETSDLIVDLHGNLRSRVLAFRQGAPVLRASSYRLRRARWVHARWSRPQPVPAATRRYAEALQPLGIEAGATPRMHVDGSSEAWADEQRAGMDRAPIALCPGARHATKQWPEAKWVELHDRLQAAGERMVVFALEAERRALPQLSAHVADAAGSAWCTEPLPRIAALLSHCRCAVTHDSGLMHVAAARGTRVVALFGSTSPVLGFAPAGEGHDVICRNEPCQPCTLHGRDSCPKGHFRCMKGIDPEEIEARLA